MRNGDPPVKSDFGSSANPRFCSHAFGILDKNISDPIRKRTENVPKIFLDINPFSRVVIVCFCGFKNSIAPDIRKHLNKNKDLTESKSEGRGE